MLRAQLQERPLAVLSRREAPYDGRAILLIRTGYNRYEFRIDGGPSHVCTLEHLDDAAARARAPRPPDEVRDDALRQDALAHMGARRARADAARPPAAAAAAPAVAAAADPPAPGSPDLSRSSPVAPAPETPYVLPRPLTPDGGTPLSAADTALALGNPTLETVDKGGGGGGTANVGNRRRRRFLR